MLPTESRPKLDYIKDWLAQYPDDKIILYSQWTSMIDRKHTVPVFELLLTRLLSCHSIVVARRH